MPGPIAGGWPGGCPGWGPIGCWARAGGGRSVGAPRTDAAIVNRFMMSPPVRLVFHDGVERKDRPADPFEAEAREVGRGKPGGVHLDDLPGDRLRRPAGGGGGGEHAELFR